MDKIYKDFSESETRDLVRCNQCVNEFIVDYDADICPICGKDGCLMDIQQNITIN